MKALIPFAVALLFGCNSKKQPPSAPAAASSVEAKAPVNEIRKNRFDSIGPGRDWHYINLSKQFDIHESVHRYLVRGDVGDSSIVKLALTNKLSNVPMDTITSVSTLLFGDYFARSKDVVSFSTRIDIKGEGDDNYYGDLVIADLNFDSKDDIAVINDMGGNAGPSYSFFLQGQNGKFILNKFLTDSMGFFPSKINKKNQTLTTLGHAGVAWVGENIFAFNRETNNWVHKSYRLLGPKIRNHEVARYP